MISALAHRLRNLPVRGKLVAMITGVAFGALILSSALIAVDQFASFRAEAVHDAEMHAEVIGDNSSAALLFGDREQAERNLRSLRSDPEILWAALYDRGGRLFASYCPVDPCSNTGIPETAPVADVRVENETIVVSKALVFQGEPTGHIAIGNGMEKVYRTMGTRFAIALAVVTIAMLFSLVLASKIQQIITDPVVSLADVVEQVSNTRNYSLRAAAHGNDELGSLVSGFNRMLNEIESRDSRLQREIADRIIAEEKYRASQERYRTLFELASDAIMIADADSGILIDGNRRAHELMGLAKGELRGMHQADLHPPEHAERYRTIFAEHVFDDGGVATDVFVRNKAGVDVAVEISASVIDLGGRQVVLGIFRDVSERKKAEQALRESEERFSAFAETTQDMIHLFDTDGRIFYVNAATERLLGYSREEVTGLHLEALIHPDEMHTVAEDMERLASEKFSRPHTVRLRKKDGAWIFAEASAFLLDIPGRIPCFGAVIRDMTWRREAEKDLRFSRFALEKSQDAMFWISADGRIWHANESACRSLGYRKDELTGMTVHDVDLQFPHDAWDSHRQGTTRLGSTIIESVHRRKDGTLFPVEVSINYLEYEGQELHCAFARNISDRKERERRLRESEERFRAIASATQDMIHLFDEERHFVFANPATETLLGYTLEEFLGLSVDDVLHPDEKAAVIAAVDASFARGTSAHVPREIRLRRKDGLYIDVEVSDFFLELDGKKRRFIGGVLRDITQRKLQERELRESEQRYRAIVQDQTEFVNRFVAGGRLTFANDALCRFLGASPEDLMGRSFYPFLPEEDRAEVIRSIEALSRANPTVELENRITMPDGSLRWTQWTTRAILGDGGNVDEYQGVGRDITDRKTAEQRLFESERRSRALSKQLEGVLEAIEDPLLLFDHDLKVLWANQSAAAAFSRGTVEPSSGKFCYTDCHERNHPCVQCPVRECFSSREPSGNIQTTSDGRVWTVRAFPVFEDEGSVKHVIKAMTDITEKILLEGQRQDIQDRLGHINKMAALGTLVSGVAHEISNPNNAIMFYGPILLEAWNDTLARLAELQDEDDDFLVAGIPFSELSQSLPDMFQAITESSKRIAAIVENLRDFARRGPDPHHVETDINLAVRTSLLILANQTRRMADRFTAELGEDLPPVRGNQQKLEQVIINLVLNAIHAVETDKGPVRVSTRLDESTQDVVIEVVDGGTGMDADTIARVAEPFFTTKQQKGGLGLGLSICDSIVQQHGGRLDFESEVGKGTVARVTLPLARGSTIGLPSSANP